PDDLLRRERIGERKHRDRVPDLRKFAGWLRADPLRRGICRYELGMLALERAKLRKQRVVFRVRDARTIELVVQAIVVCNLAAQLGDPRTHRLLSHSPRPR